jgi:hypothetical protein
MQSGRYYVLETVNSQFYAIYNILDFHFYRKHFRSENLLEWLYDKEKTVDGNEFFDVRKKDGAIALYDRSEWLEGEECRSIFPDENKRFDMSYKNFEELLLRWEDLRVSMPEIILLVIHEDNHVSLETDPTIIKEYQDAGYAFDIDKKIK